MRSVLIVLQYFFAAQYRRESPQIVWQHRIVTRQRFVHQIHILLQWHIRVGIPVQCQEVIIGNIYYDASESTVWRCKQGTRGNIGVVLISIGVNRPVMAYCSLHRSAETLEPGATHKITA